MNTNYFANIIGDIQIFIDFSQNNQYIIRMFTNMSIEYQEDGQLVQYTFNPGVYVSLIFQTNMPQYGWYICKQDDKLQTFLFLLLDDCVYRFYICTERLGSWPENGKRCTNLFDSCNNYIETERKDNTKGYLKSGMFNYQLNLFFQKVNKGLTCILLFCKKYLF